MILAQTYMCQELLAETICSKRAEWTSRPKPVAPAVGDADAAVVITMAVWIMR
jgi:hypothetical protein